jgi:hypothetical protein
MFIGGPVKIGARFLILTVLFASLLCAGCAIKLFEKPATETEPSSTTQLKFDGPKVKVTSNF